MWHTLFPRMNCQLAVFTIIMNNYVGQAMRQLEAVVRAHISGKADDWGQQRLTIHMRQFNSLLLCQLEAKDARPEHWRNLIQVTEHDNLRLIRIRQCCKQIPPQVSAHHRSLFYNKDADVRQLVKSVSHRRKSHAGACAIVSFHIKELRPELNQLMDSHTMRLQVRR